MGSNPYVAFGTQVKSSFDFYKHMINSTYKTTLQVICIVVWIVLFGFFCASLSDTKGRVIENKMVEVELLRIVDHSPVYIDIRDLSTGIEYKSVYVSEGFDDFDQLPYNCPFLVTRLKRLNEKDGEIRVEWRDLHSGLDWSKRYKH